MTLFIGDVHGKYSQYKKLIKEATAMNKPTIQVGDMGVGFLQATVDGIKPAANPPYDYMVAGNHRFIRGNHDNPEECAKHSQWIKDGHYDSDTITMFIGGAVSVDKLFRTEGWNYWETEELTSEALRGLIIDYEKVKPVVMVTHDCPEPIALEMIRLSGRNKLDYPSRTRDALTSMWEIHQPELWVFGHWHKSADFKADNTRFVCLDELEMRELT